MNLARIARLQKSQIFVEGRSIRIEFKGAMYLNQSLIPLTLA